MPLSFESLTHGPVAFGFFNIESDMLLLDTYFFFCEDFCGWISDLADMQGPGGIDCDLFHIPDPNDVGDLMGAIHGVLFTGFIGNLYTRFPFPADPADFKQQPDGDRNRDAVLAEIAPFATRKRLYLGIEDGNFSFGSYEFDRQVFRELIQYVWQGGYPRWKHDTRPACVTEMRGRVLISRNRFFNGVFP